MALDLMNEDAASVPDQGATDAALVQGLRDRTPEAAQQLCQRFGPMLFTFAVTHFPGERETAQDLMIQSLADAARNIAHYDPRKASFRVWLYRLTRGDRQRTPPPHPPQSRPRRGPDLLRVPPRRPPRPRHLNPNRLPTGCPTPGGNAGHLCHRVGVPSPRPALPRRPHRRRNSPRPQPVGASRPLTPTPGENQSPRKVAPRCLKSEWIEKSVN